MVWLEVYAAVQNVPRPATKDMTASLCVQLYHISLCFDLNIIIYYTILFVYNSNFSIVCIYFKFRFNHINILKSLYFSNNISIYPHFIKIILPNLYNPSIYTPIPMHHHLNLNTLSLIRIKETHPTAYCDCWERCKCKSLIQGNSEARFNLLKCLIQETSISEINNKFVIFIILDSCLIHFTMIWLYFNVFCFL